VNWLAMLKLLEDTAYENRQNRQKPTSVSFVGAEPEHFQISAGAPGLGTCITAQLLTRKFSDESIGASSVLHWTWALRPTGEKFP
jgi:hypothetical protein